MDFLDPLPMISSGNQYTLVFIDEYNKLTSAIPVTKLTITYATFIFVDHWIIPFGAPTHLLTDNGPNSSLSSSLPFMDKQASDTGRQPPIIPRPMLRRND